MARITIEDPEELKKKLVDSQGRVYLGKEYKNERIRFVFEVLE